MTLLPAPMPRSLGGARPLYTGLRVRDVARSCRFYRALGFRQTLRLKTEIGVCVQLEHPRNRFTIEFNQFRKGTRSWEPHRRGTELDHIGFWVDDVDQWIRRLSRVGGNVKVEAHDTPIVIPPKPWFNGRAAFVADPDGVWIELIGPRKDSSSKTR